jgi:apolipoprotein N-acyltransferase
MSNLLDPWQQLLTLRSLPGTMAVDLSTGACCMGRRASRVGRRIPPKGAAAKAAKPPTTGTAPGAEVRLPFDGFKSSLLLSLASVALLSAAFPPLGWTWLAHVALVPMLVAIVRAPNRRVLLGAGAVSGIVFYGGQMYWMTMISWASWAGTVVYCLAFWLLFVVLLKWVTRRLAWPLALTVPVLWVALEFVRSGAWAGGISDVGLIAALKSFSFPWLYLGHPQAASLTLLQVADITGAYGLSALSAATAALLADGVTRPLFLRYGTRVRMARSLRISALAIGAVWVAVIVYGMVQLRPVETRDGPLVVTIQTNVKQELKWHTPESPRQEDGSTTAPPGNDAEPAAETDPSYDQAMRLTAEAARQWPDADLVVWPETTAVDYLNSRCLDRRFKTLEQIKQDPVAREYYDRDPEKFAANLAVARRMRQRARRRWGEIRELADRTAPILVGAMGMLQDDRVRRFNSAYLFTGDAGEATTPGGRLTYGNSGVYHKVHLVPFGEFVPFRDSAPWLYRLLMSFTPYTDDYNLARGDAFTLMPAGGVPFATAICFEDAFSDVCREMVYPGGAKTAEFLVNISNDGWFYGTVELEQHWDLSVFRAVENRVPVVRSVNTGISGFIDSCGRTVSRVTDGAGHVRSVAGSGAERLGLDPRWSFYGVYGDVFAWLLSLGAVGFIIMALLAPRRQGDQSNSQAKESES